MMRSFWQLLVLHVLHQLAQLVNGNVVKNQSMYSSLNNSSEIIKLAVDQIDCIVDMDNPELQVKRLLGILKYSECLVFPVLC